MRILIFNPSYPPAACGVGAYTRDLAAALVKAGHEVTVVTESGVTDASPGPPRVLPLLREWSVSAYLRAWPRFARPRPEVVVSSFPAAVRSRYSRLLYLVPALAKATLGRPRTVFIVHEFVRTGDTERGRLKLALRPADAIVAVTEAERDGIATRYPWAAKRTVVRHNVPTIGVAAPDVAQDALLRDTLAVPGRPLVAFFGLLWGSNKGFEELLEAVAGSGAELLATGALDPTNAYHAQIEAVIDRLGIAERVHWLGFLPDEQVARVLRVADMVALPFRGGAESGYTTLLAALVNGAAVITTRGPNNPPWLRDGETALLIEAGNAAAIAAAITRLATDPQLAARLREGGRSLSFGWGELVATITETG